MHWAFDFERSFGEHSDGRSDEEVMDSKGARLLGMRTWRAGDEAIRILRSAVKTGDGQPAPVSAIAEMMDELVRQTDDFLCRDFFPDLLQMVGEGRVDTGGVDAQRLQEIWQEYDVPSRAGIFFQMVNAWPLALGEPEAADFLPFVYQMAAVCTLWRVNDAAIAAFLDGRGLDEAGAEVERFQNYMHPPRQMIDAIAAAKRMALSQRAAANAALAHAPRNAVRDWILSEWEKFKTETPNKSEFARIYTRRLKQERGVSVTEKTIREVWLRDTPAASKRARKLAAGE